MIGELGFATQVFGGTAPCDWLGKDLTVTATTVAVITFVGNASSACMADSAGVPILGQALVDKYEADITALIAQVRSVGALVLLVGQPPLGGTESDEARAQLTALYAELADPDGAVFSVLESTGQDAPDRSG